MDHNISLFLDNETIIDCSLQEQELLGEIVTMDC